MKKAWVLGLVLLLPIILAQESETFEDFESYPTGSAAGLETNIGTVVEEGGSGSCTATIATPGLDGTGKKLRFTQPGGNARCRIDIDTDLRDVTVVSFYFRGHVGGSDSGSSTFRFQQSGNRLVELNLQGGLDHRIIHAQSACDGSATTTTFTGKDVNSEIKVVFTFNYGAQSFSYDIDDGDFTGTKQFRDCSSQPQITNLIYFPASQPDMAIDQIIWDGTEVLIETEEEPTSPSEFSSGLDAFLASISMVSPESQLLFAIMLVGFTTVGSAAALRWVASSRIKNYVILGLKVAVGIFCVFAAFMELWVLVALIVLSASSVQGGQLVRNTWSEVRSTLRRGRRTSTPQEAAPMEPQAEPPRSKGADATSPEAPAAEPAPADPDVSDAPADSAPTDQPARQDDERDGGDA